MSLAPLSSLRRAYVASVAYGIMVGYHPSCSEGAVNQRDVSAGMRAKDAHRLDVHAQEGWAVPEGVLRNINICQ